jgi:hypothetical protein
MIFDDSVFTHMPYIFEGKLLHCRADKGGMFINQIASPWIPDLVGEGAKLNSYQMYISDLDGTNIEQISENTLGGNIVCSPCAFRDEDNNYVISYVGSNLTAEAGMLYQHYRRCGATDWTDVGESKRVVDKCGLPVYCTTEGEKYKLFAKTATTGGFILAYNKDISTCDRWGFTNMGELRRVIPVEDKPNHCILTLIPYNSDEYVAILFDLRDGSAQEIIVEGESEMYKCSISGTDIVYAKNSIPDEYSMQLYKSTYTLQPITLNVSHHNENFIST